MTLIPFDQWQRWKPRFLARRVGRSVHVLGMLGPHVVGIGQPKILVEAVLERQEFGMVSQVPLAEDGRRVSLLSAEFSQGHFVGVNAHFGGRSECAGNADPSVIAAGHQTGSRRRADGRRDDEVGETHSIAGHLIEMRCRIVLRAERTNVRVAHVVNEDDDDVGGVGGLAARRLDRGGSAQHRQAGDQRGNTGRDECFAADNRVCEASERRSQPMVRIEGLHLMVEMP